MADTRMTHRGHEVQIGGGAGGPHLSIDGEDVQVSQVTPSDFATQLLPFSNFPSLEALAQAVIDHSPQYNGRRDVT